MEQMIVPIVRELAKVLSFEDAATLILKRMLEVAVDALRESPYRDKGSVRRGMVHLRPKGGYSGLVVLETENWRLAGGEGDKALHPSASAWRWVEQHRCGVVIDVNLGVAHVLGEPPSSTGWTIDGPPAPFNSQESRLRLLGRNATHLCVLPLRLPGNQLGGMVSIEAFCPSAMGKTFVWHECGGTLQVLADLAAPYLASLPRQPRAVVTADSLLPVVGPSMAGMIDTLRVFAQQEETILLCGPTGSGKSRMARWCHACSPRKDGPFESVDIHTVPEELQLGELFGWKSGAFTGAVGDYKGRVTRATGGTLFIDEIDKLSMRAQASLLKLLEERRYQVLGDATGDREADTRFIVGTNADLFAEVRAGRFREDLFYRINVLPVNLPPLKERTDEIPLWARFMLERRHGQDHRKGSVCLAADAELVLLEQSWPGNLRQLDNVLRRAYSLALVEYGGDTSDILIRDRHVEHALQLEGRVPVNALISTLKLAAQAFVEEAERRKDDGRPVDLQLTEAFQGFVLLTSLKKRRSLESVYRFFGRSSLVENRNHHRAARKELLKLRRLYEAFDQPVDPEVDALTERWTESADS